MIRKMLTYFDKFGTILFYKSFYTFTSTNGKLISESSIFYKILEIVTTSNMSKINIGILKTKNIIIFKSLPDLCFFFLLLDDIFGAFLDFNVSGDIDGSLVLVALGVSCPQFWQNLEPSGICFPQLLQYINYSPINLVVYINATIRELISRSKQMEI